MTTKGGGLRFLEDRWDDAVASKLDEPELLRFLSDPIVRLAGVHRPGASSIGRCVVSPNSHRGSQVQRPFPAIGNG